MLRLLKPSPATLARFRDQQSPHDFTYPAVGATSDRPPAGYVVDHTRVSLGQGDEIFASARAALEDWRQFDLGWVSAWPPRTPIETGQVVVILARCLGIWWLNASRIVYVIDERADHPRFGYAYGTLPGHAESGEERFLIEMAEDGTVWYDILAFSRPRHPLARLGYAYVRMMQRRFGRHSAAAMRSVVAAPLRS
ncbi:MAG: DUF1990 domain-containing protein [Pirellulaceae bacterium]|nr:DUF1990 domain-containing protein [Pirellulaceae bacterium]